MIKFRRRNKFQPTHWQRQITPPPRAHWWWQQLLIIISFILLMTGIWYLFISDTFKVDTVELEGLVSLPAEQVSSSLQLEGNNIFLVKTQSVEEKLSSWSEILSVRLVRLLPRKIKVIIKERQPILLWRSVDKNYQVDQTGVAFRVVDVTNAWPRVVDIANVQVNLGQPVVPASFMQAFNYLQAELPNIYADKIDFYEVSETVYDLDLVLKNGHRVRFNILSDVRQQLVELKRLQELRPDLFDRSVVDLRVDRWAFVK